MKNIRLLSFFLCLVLLMSCSPNSQEDFQLEAQGVCRLLAEELQTVKNREGLREKMPVLKKYFSRLVDIIIEARTYQSEHPELVWNATLFVPENGSQVLQEEMHRIYQFEGGRELIEEAERAALVRLDRFERDMADKKSKRNKR